jgi:hypothetical protein
MADLPFEKAAGIDETSSGDRSQPICHTLPKSTHICIYIS